MFSAASVCLWVCMFVCQHDSFQTSKHRMMKLEGKCIAQKSRPSSNLGVIAPRWGAQPSKMCRFAESWCITQNMNKAMRSNETSHRTHSAHRTCVRLRRWENQHRLSSLSLKCIQNFVDFCKLRPTRISWAMSMSHLCCVCVCVLNVCHSLKCNATKLPSHNRMNEWMKLWKDDFKHSANNREEFFSENLENY